MNDIIRTGPLVVDERGRRFELLRPLRAERSGFGELWLTTSDGVVIKFWKEGRSPGLTLGEFDLDGLPIAKPESAVTAPAVGYLMKLQRGMVTLQQLLERADTDTGIPPVGAPLLALRRLCEVVACLHARGLVFGDLHARNVLSSPDGESLVLIDLDTVTVNRRPYPPHQAVILGSRARRARFRKSGTTAALEDTWAIADMVRGYCQSLSNQTGVPETDLEAHLMPQALETLRGLRDLTTLPPDDLPSASMLWQQMSVSEDGRIVCRACGLPYSWRASCPECQRPSGATSIGIRSECTGRVQRILVPAAGRAAIRRRHILGGPDEEADSVVGWLVNDGTVVLLDVGPAPVAFGREPTHADVTVGGCERRVTLEVGR